MNISCCCCFFYFEFNYKLTFERKQLYPLLSRITFIDTHTHSDTITLTHTYASNTNNKKKCNSIEKANTWKQLRRTFFCYTFVSIFITFIQVLLMFVFIRNSEWIVDFHNAQNSSIAPFNFVSIQELSTNQKHWVNWVRENRWEKNTALVFVVSQLGFGTNPPASDFDYCVFGTCVRWMWMWLFLSIPTSTNRCFSKSQNRFTLRFESLRLIIATRVYIYHSVCWMCSKFICQ